MQNKVPGAQWNAWLLAALLPALFSIIGRNGWITVLLTAVVTGVLCFSVHTCKHETLPKWLCVLELGWLIIFLGGLARIGSACWMQVDAFPGISVILLILAALAAHRGAMQAARTGATLMWLVLPVLGIVFLAGTAEINPEWIRMELDLPDGMLVSLLLIPCLGLYLPRGSSSASKWIAVVIGAVTIAAAALMDASMGSAVASTAASSFYEFSKGVNLFGVAERFEALVACALTAGWFALYTLILSAVYHLAEKIFLPARKWAVWIAAIAGAGLMCILPNTDSWMAMGALIFWVFLPAATQGIGGIKKIEKK